MEVFDTHKISLAVLDMATYLRKFNAETECREPLNLEEMMVAAEKYRAFVCQDNADMRLSCLRKAHGAGYTDVDQVLVLAQKYLDFVIPKNEFVPVVDESAWNEPRKKSAPDYGLSES